MKKSFLIPLFAGILFLFTAQSSLAALPFLEKGAKSVKGEKIVPEESVVRSETDLPFSSAHKSIVKVKAYIEYEDQLVNAGSGSGIILSSDGLVLTNYHVVTSKDRFDDSEKPGAYRICLTEEIVSEPECGYYARLISKNKELDMALLKIFKIEGLSKQSVFQPVELNNVDGARVNDEVYAFGYPGIGGDTITITKGIISGKAEKYGVNWMKTDAVVSFGSSGGAAFNKNGKVIGVTSASYSDFAGSLGYIISSASISGWVDANKDLPVSASGLEDRIIALTKKEHLIKTSSRFENDSPRYSIEKPEGWTFFLGAEKSISMTKEGDEDGGAIEVVLMRMPYAANKEDIMTIIKTFYAASKMLGNMEIRDLGDVSIGGAWGKKLALTIYDETMNLFIFAVDDYLVILTPYYGRNDKDKAVVDSAINTFRTENSSKIIPEIHTHVNDNPAFSITFPDQWYIIRKGEKRNPFIAFNKEEKGSMIGIEVEKFSSANSQTNDEYLAKKLKDIEKTNKYNELDKIKVVVIESNAHFKLNDKLSNVIMIKSVLVNENKPDANYYSEKYIIKSKASYIVAELVVLSSDSGAISRASSDFLSSMQKMEAPDYIDGGRGGTKSTASKSEYDGTGESSIKDEDTAKVLIKSGKNEKKIEAKKRKMNKKLKGKIIIKVQDNGEAYYVDPKDNTAYFLGRPDDAFKVMREQGVGISNKDLEKIPVGISDTSGPDADGDGLSDSFEDALGTDKNKKDTDGDTYDDKIEIAGGYSPKVKNKKQVSDANFSGDQKGKIVLQVEGKGEAWYINPNDGKRYFLGRPADAFRLMRSQGLGISNGDFEKLAED